MAIACGIIIPIGVMMWIYKRRLVFRILRGGAGAAKRDRFRAY